MPSSPRRGFDRGTSHYGPLRTRFKPEGSSREYESQILNWSPRLISDHFEDFDTAPLSNDIILPLTGANGFNLVAVTNALTYTAEFRVPRGGVVTAVDFVGGTTLATDNTNYVTFSLTNKRAGGAGSTALLLATDASTTKTTGGSAITADIPRVCGLSAVAGALNVAPGDVLKFVLTNSGTLANTIVQPTVRVRIQTISSLFIPGYIWTAGAPQIQNVANSANGEVILKLEATNEEQIALLLGGDQLCIDPTKSFHFSARVKATLPAASVERFVIGLGSAGTDPFDSTTINAWFRCDGSLLLNVETDDNTTDSALTSTGFTLTAGTYYVFTIDGTDLGNVKFYLDDVLLYTLSMKDMVATTKLQPTIAIQKDSGTGVSALTVDYVRWMNFRI